MLRSVVAGNVVTRVVVKVHALQIVYVAVAVRQHHVECGIVHDETIEVDWREREHGFDAVWRAQSIVQYIVTHDALAATRVAHRSHTSQIELADENSSEGRAAGGVEGVEDVEMFLHQLCARECAEIEDEIIYGVDSVCAHRNNYITITRESFSNVIVSLKTGNRLAAVCRAGHSSN